VPGAVDAPQCTQRLWSAVCTCVIYFIPPIFMHTYQSSDQSTKQIHVIRYIDEGGSRITGLGQVEEDGIELTLRFGEALALLLRVRALIRQTHDNTHTTQMPPTPTPDRSATSTCRPCPSRRAGGSGGSC
jgi:hypothetical protein